VIDCHATIVPEDLEEARKLGVNLNRAGGGILEATPAKFIAQMDGLGLRASVVWRVAKDNQTARLANEWIASVVRQYPDRLIGFASVYPPDYEGAIRELEWAIGYLGLVGLKVHPKNQRFPINDPGFLKLAGRAAEERLPLVLHVNMTLLPGEAVRDELSDFAEASLLPCLLDVYDSPKVMSAHMGGVFLEAVAASKISFQTTGASQEVIEEACRRVGHQRVLFGSDYPGFSVEEELERVRAAAIGETAKGDVLGDNFARLLSH